MKPGEKQAAWPLVALWAAALGMALCPPAYADAVAREVSVWNNPRTPAATFTDAVARELGVFNQTRLSAVVAIEAVARETVVFNDPRLTARLVADALARELTVGAGALPPSPNDALRVAGGHASGSGQMGALNTVTTGASANRIDILDAVRLMRKQAGLDP